MTSPAPSRKISSGGKASGKQTAGAFDVRSVIAGLLGFYGVVLTVYGLVKSSTADLHKAGGFNANLWTGVVLLVVALVFGLWVRLRPVVVAGPQTGETVTTSGDTAGH